MAASYTKTRFVARRAPSGRLVHYDNSTWQVGKWPDFDVPRPCDMTVAKETAHSHNGFGGLDSSLGAVSTDVLSDYALYPPSRNQQDLYNRAYGNFLKAIRSSDSSLGVTLASYKQTRDMLTKRIVDLSACVVQLSRTKRLASTLRSDFLEASFTGESKRLAKSWARTDLELVFGWYPLLKEIEATSKLLSSMDIPGTYLNGKATSAFTTEPRSFPSQMGTLTVSSDGVQSCTLATAVRVTNPNLHLADKAGFANLPLVAWDLVPWSFVVNMFGNFNQVIGSFSDFAGLSFGTVSVTNTTKGLCVHEYRGSLSSYPNLSTRPYGQSSAFMKKKVRTVGGSPPRPRLVLQLPNVTTFTVTTALALITTRVGAIGKLLVNR